MDRAAMLVVSGLPRSGTSLVLSMLAAAGIPVFEDAARPPDAHNPDGYRERSAVRRIRRDTAVLAGARGHAVKVVAPLLTSLPLDRRYRVIFVERSLDAVLQSQEAMGGSALPDRARLRTAYEVLLPSLRAWLSAHPDVFSTFFLTYESLVADPVASASRLASFVGVAPTGMAEQVRPRTP